MPGCPDIALPDTGRCALHSAEQRATADARRPAPHVRGYDYDWRKTRADVLKRFPTCAICGERATIVHHILPLAAGGTDDLDNLESMCKTCHDRHTARYDGGWGRVRAER